MPGFRHVACPRHFEGSAPPVSSPPPPRQAELPALLHTSASHCSLGFPAWIAHPHSFFGAHSDFQSRLRNGEHTRLRLGHGPARCGVAGPGLARRERGREQLDRARRGHSASCISNQHLAVARCHLRHVCNVTSVWWWSELFFFSGFVSVAFRHYLESCFRKCEGPPFLWPCFLGAKMLVV